MSTPESSVSRLRARLRNVAQRQLKISAWRGLLLTLATICLTWFVVSGLEALLWMSPLGRFFALSVVVFVALGVAFWQAGYPLLRFTGLVRPPTASEGAQLIGDAFPGTSERALTLLDLVDGHRSEAPEEILSLATSQLSESVRAEEFEQAVSADPIRQSARFASLPVLLLLVSFLIFPASLQQASERLLSPSTIYTKPAPFDISVEPGDAEFMRGESAELTATLDGDDLPQDVAFLIREEDSVEQNSYDARRTGDGSFTLTRNNVRNSFTYKVSAGGFESETYSAEVVQRPVISEMQVRITPPPYTGESIRDLPANQGDVYALPESQVQVQLSTEGPRVSDGHIKFDNDDSVPLTLHPEGASASFTLDREGTYTIHLKDEEGRANPQSVAHSLELREDMPPQIRLVSPGPTAELADSHTALLRARIQDDFGFHELRLFYRKGDSGEFSSIELPIEDPADTHQIVEFPWRLKADTDLEPAPGESVEYFLEVWDNDRPGGFKSDRTETHRLYAPTVRDRSVALQEQQRRLNDQMEALFSEEEAFRSATRDFRSEAQRQSSRDGYERDTGEISERHRDLARQTEELTRDLESALREMDQPRQQDNDAAELFQQLQQMSEDMGIDDLSDALRQLQEAMQQDRQEGAEDAMARLQQQEQSFQDRLERMQDLLKQLNTRQQLDALADESREMAEQQESLADAARDARESGDLTDEEQQAMADDQDALAEMVEQFEERMASALEDMEDVRGAPRSAMQEMIDQAQEQDLAGRMQESADQVQDGDMQAAEQSQSETAQIFQDMQEQFEDMQAQMSMQQEQLNITAIRQALRNTIALSEQQEELMAPARDLSPGSDEQRARAASQHRLSEGLAVVSDTLQTLVRSVPMVSGSILQQSRDAESAMREALDELTGRSPNRATSAQQEARTNLNALALTLSHLLEQMQDGDGGGSSSMEQLAQDLEQMAGDQEQMNEEIQQMLNEMQGERLSGDQQERIDQLAEQHQRLREQLQERREEAGEGDADIQELEQAADEMEEVISDLRRERLSSEEQREILMRLLETRRSMREQDQSPERRAEVAEGTYERESLPAELPEMEPRELLYQDILRYRQSRYARQYEALIQRYFEHLSRENSPQTGN